MNPKVLCPSWSFAVLVTALYVNFNGGVAEFLSPSSPVSSDPLCWKSSKKSCIARPVNSCLGGVLQYDYTGSLRDDFDVGAISKRLQSYENLRLYPDCWNPFREAFCNVLIPPCDKSEGHVSRASKRLCERARDACPFFVNSSYWPVELGSCGKNEDQSSSAFAQDGICERPEMQLFQWNYSRLVSCVHPLVVSQDRNRWMFGITKCALSCRNPWLSPDEAQHTRRFGHVLALIGLFLCMFTCLPDVMHVIASRVAWCVTEDHYAACGVDEDCDMRRERRSSVIDPRYPALGALVWSLMAFVLVYISWSIASLPGAFELLSCRPDGSIRFDEPSSGTGSNELACAIQGFFLLFGLNSVATWLLVFAVWHFKCYTTSVCEAREWIGECRTWFFLLTVGGPIIVGYFALAFTAIDTDGITGICFPGYNNPLVLLLFVHVPWTLCVVVSVVLVIIAGHRRHSIRVRDQRQLSSRFSLGACHSSKCVSWNFGVLFVIISVLIIASAFLVLCDYRNLPKRQSALHDYILCNLMPNVFHAQKTKDASLSAFDCRLAFEGVVDVRYPLAHMFVLFCVCCLINLWFWLNGGALFAWKRLFLGLRSHLVICVKKRRARSGDDEAQLPLNDEGTVEHGGATAGATSSRRRIETPVIGERGRGMGRQSTRRRSTSTGRKRRSMSDFREDLLQRSNSMASLRNSLKSLLSPASSTTLPPFSSMSSMGFPDQSSYPIMSPEAQVAAQLQWYQWCLYMNYISSYLYRTSATSSSSGVGTAPPPATAQSASAPDDNNAPVAPTCVPPWFGVFGVPPPYGVGSADTPPKEQRRDDLSPTTAIARESDEAHSSQRRTPGAKDDAIVTTSSPDVQSDDDDIDALPTDSDDDDDSSVDEDERLFVEEQMRAYSFSVAGSTHE